MASAYQFNYYSPTGESIQQGLSVSKMTMARKENEVGSASMVLVGIDDPEFFVRDGIIEILRSVDDGPLFVDGQTCWIIEAKKLSRDDNGNSVLELQMVDAIGLLRRRIIPYDSNTTYAVKLDYAGNIIRALFLENFGSSALDPTRDCGAFVTASPAANLGAILSVDVGWRNVLDEMKSAANASFEKGIPVFFDLVRRKPGYYNFVVFKDYMGVDRTRSSTTASPVIVSDNNKNLGSPELIYNFTEAYNHVYYGGNGDERWKLYKESSNTIEYAGGPFARTEAYFEDTNLTDPVKVQDAADSKLKKGRPRILFAGKILDTPTFRYGKDYKYGDFVTAEYNGKFFDCRVSSISIEYGFSGESITAALKGEQSA